MIDYYENPHKKIVLKVIASLMVITFIWYDVAWAGDLFYLIRSAQPAGTGQIRRKKYRLKRPPDKLDAPIGAAGQCIFIKRVQLH